MRHRGQRLGLTSPENPTGIAVPLNLWDGESFPASVGDIQRLDLRKYLLVGKAFEDSPLYVTFQQELQTWIPQLARLIADAPNECERDWASPEWLDVSYEELLIPPTKIRQPRMV